MEKLELFQNLVVLAASDGKFTDEEVEALAVRAERWNISPVDFNSILVGLQSGDIDLILPEGHQARIELITEMIRVMAADGELAEIEKELCATAAAKMEIDGKQFESILNSLI